MKPGQSKNIPDPSFAVDTALANVRSVASGSRQTSDTTQTATMDPNGDRKAKMKLKTTKRESMAALRARMGEPVAEG